MSVNATLTENRSHQEIYERVKLPVKEDMYMNYDNGRKPLYLETDTLRVGLCTTLWQVRENLNFLI